jgi:hypothetical protein
MPREEVKVPGGPAPVRRASLPSLRSMVPGHSLCCWNANEVRSPHPPHAGTSDRFFCDVWMQNVYPANRRQPCRRIHRESRRARPRGLSRLRPVFRYERCCLHRGPLQFRSQLQRRPKYAQRCHDPSIAFGTSAGDIHAAVETDALVRHDEPAPRVVSSALGAVPTVCVYRLRAAEMAFSAWPLSMDCPSLFCVCANVTDAIRTGASRKGRCFMCLMCAE